MIQEENGARLEGTRNCIKVFGEEKSAKGVTAAEVEGLEVLGSEEQRSGGEWKMEKGRGGEQVDGRHQIWWISGSPGRRRGLAVRSEEGEKKALGQGWNPIEGEL